MSSQQAAVDEARSKARRNKVRAVTQIVPQINHTPRGNIPSGMIDI